MSKRTHALEAAIREARALLARRRFAEAEALCNRMNATSPNHADTMALLALLAVRGGQFDTAAEWLARACGRKPASSARYIVECAGTLLELGQPARALAAAEQVLHDRPNHAEALQTMGHALSDLGRPHDAVAAYSRALALKPALFDIHNNLALALRESDQLEAAEPMFRAAALREPKDVLLRANHAGILKDLGRLDEAEAGYREALRLDPGKAIPALQPGHPAAARRPPRRRFCGVRLALCRRCRGRPEIQPAGMGRGGAGGAHPAGPRRAGVWADAIQMARYLSRLPTDGTIVLEVPRPLVRLLTGISRARVIQSGDALPDFETHCPMMSLPTAFATEAGSVPADVPYLRTDPNRVAHWRRQVGSLPGRAVGIAWAGNPGDVRLDRKRSIALETLAPLADIPGISWVSLQLGRPGELAASKLGAVSHDWTAELQDMAETANLVAALDLVVSVDTAVAHLAGALGRPVWLLNRFDTDWRWGLERPDCLWYPTLRQFRQAAPGDWAGVVRQVADTLA